MLKKMLFIEQILNETLVSQSRIITKNSWDNRWIVRHWFTTNAAIILIKGCNEMKI